MMQESRKSDQRQEMVEFEDWNEMTFFLYFLLVSKSMRVPLQL